MGPIPQVRGSAYLPFVEFLEAAGATVETGVDSELMSSIVRRNSEAFVPMHLAHRFLARGARKIGQQDFGILVGRKIGVESLGAFGRSVRRSLTLHDALGKFHLMFPLYSSAERIWWERDRNNLAFFLHSYLQKPDCGSRYARDCALLLMRDVIRLAAGRHWQPEIVKIDDLENASALREEFGDAEIRHSKFNGLSFSQNLLSRPLRQPHSCGSSARDEEAFDAGVPSGDFLGSLRQVIATFLPEGRCGLEEVAAALGVHPRTLQRRLAARDHDYSELLSRVLFEKTLHLLEDPCNRIHDIALEVGFQDASNFSRSFRQWAGVTPSQFRERNMGKA